MRADIKKLNTYDVMSADRNSRVILDLTDLGFIEENTSAYSVNPSI
jgi:hypothetical protein